MTRLDRKIAPNIWRRSSGSWRILVRAFDPATGRMRAMPTRQPASWTLADCEEYRDTAQLEARRLKRQWRETPQPAVPETTFTADAQRYLALEVVRAMPSLAARTVEIEKWITIFGERRRRTITAMDIDAALQRLVNEGYSGSTVNKFRTALMSLWTRLDGRSAANPVKDTQVSPEAELLPRGQSYALLERILALIPDTGAMERTRLYAEIWRAPLATIAPRYGVSDSFLHRMCRQLAVPTPPRGYWRQTVTARPARPPLPPATSISTKRVPLAAKQRAWLEVLAWTGMDPSQLQRMDPRTHLSIQDGWYITPHRRKGSRRSPTPRPVYRKPLSLEAARAFQRLTELEAWEPFDTAVLRRAWYRATARCEAQLRQEYGDTALTLPRIKLKDIRHSFATALYEQTRDLNVVRQMIDHAANSPLTIRYSLGAVPSVLRAHVRAFPRRVTPTSD